MAEILKFEKSNSDELFRLRDKILEELDDLEDQIYDLEEYEPEDDEKELALWKEEYNALVDRFERLEKQLDEIESKLKK